MKATYNKLNLRPVRNSSFPTNHQILGFEGVVVTDFSQTEDVLASLPTVQSQSNLLTEYESDQQDVSDSQASPTSIQDDSTNDERYVAVVQDG
ncbi:hypothetical protein BGX21_004892 [Mortierella sp. AD011]|nr:hypothetical protein BGX20_005046 [Mortierella sp. AD010]KAF9400153.1 hypothetical protein BGX21_004892 [Mortierella sp. AD011]